MSDETLHQAAQANPEDKFALVFLKLVESLIIDRMDQNEEIFARYMNDAAFRKAVDGWLTRQVYERLTD